MITCEHDCEFCERLDGCGEGAAERYRHDIQVAVEGHAQEAGGDEAEQQYRVEVEGCHHAALVARVARLEDLVARMRRELSS